MHAGWGRHAMSGRERAEPIMPGRDTGPVPTMHVFCDTRGVAGFRFPRQSTFIVMVRRRWCLP